MGVYADKKDGKLTGLWRVDLQKGPERYRQRHSGHAEALRDAKRVSDLWNAGGAVAPVKLALVAPTVPTLSTLRKAAEGSLWEGSDQSSVNWNQVDLIINFLGADTPLSAIDTLMIDRIIKHLKGTGRRKVGRADGTINRHLSHFRKFLTWGKDRKLLTAPISDIKFEWRKESPGRVRWITGGEETSLKALLPPNTWKLVKVAIETGCRREELMVIERHQITEGKGGQDMLHLWKTKADLARSVPLTKETSGMLLELIAGDMPTKAQLRRYWDKAKDAMGLSDDAQFVFHTCRHTCATRLADADVDVLTIKTWLGHKRIETTLRYTHVKSSNLERALARRGEVEALAS